MRVLITGASGKLGAYVIRQLAEGHELALMSRSRPASEFAQFRWIRGDLSVWEDCRRAVAGVDAIQHIGAQPWPTDHPAMQSRAQEMDLPFDATFKSNLVGTYYLMQAAVEAGVQTVVMAGSNCALGHVFRISDTAFPIDFLPIDETHPTYPEDSYSYTKRAGEDLLAAFSRAYGIRTCVTRIAGICPLERRLQMAADAKPTTVWHPGLYCWVGSEDVASAHRLPPSTSCPLRPIPPIPRTPTVTQSGQGRICWRHSVGPTAFALTSLASPVSVHWRGVCRWPPMPSRPPSGIRGSTAGWGAKMLRARIAC